nr:reverse transcriptase domain-containing protein [Tanacetum cinerariifolium]
MNTKEHERRHRSRRSRSPRPSVFSRIRRGRSRSPRQNFREKEGGIFKRLGNQERSVSARSDSHSQRSYSRYTKALSESEYSGGGHLKSRSKKKKSSREQDDFHIKAYDGSEDLEDQLKIFQAAAKTKRWVMPTWCHMFNSTLTGNTRVWFDDLPPESIDSYDDLKKAFLKNYLQQKKDVKGAPECMRISGFMHGITNPELIKRLHDKIPKTVDEMMRVTTSFLQEEVAASNHEKKKSFSPWRQQKGNQKQSFRKGIFRSQQRTERKQDRFMLLTKTPKEIFALEKGKFKAQPPMTTPIEKQNHARFYEFHGEVGHNTDESWMNFVVVRSPSLYNGIIGRPGVRKLQAVPSTAHEMLKIPVEGGIITLKSSMLVLLECGMVSGPKGSLLVTKPTVEERINVAINPEHPKQTVMIGSILTEQGRNRTYLNVWEGCSLVRKKKRGQAADRVQAIQEEVEKLMEARIMKEVGKNLEVYVDDLAIKSRTEDEIARDIEETFKTLREINMKLNPKKCTFGIEEGMFLGYKVSTRGLKKSDFYWTAEAEEAFKQMKQFIAELPMLVTPMEKEELIVYLAVAKETVSAIIMSERETKQMPIYFVSRALRGPKINYTLMEKLVLALVHASKRLKRYFQAHSIIVVTDQPIQHVLSRPEAAERQHKWSIELREYAIHYRPRVSVKGKILADFIVERPEEDSPDTLMTEEEELPEPWILFTDGSSYIDGSGAGLILTNPEGA